MSDERVVEVLLLGLSVSFFLPSFLWNYGPVSKQPSFANSLPLSGALLILLLLSGPLSALSVVSPVLY